MSDIVVGLRGHEIKIAFKDVSTLEGCLPPAVRDNLKMFLGEQAAIAGVRNAYVAIGGSVIAGQSAEIEGNAGPVAQETLEAFAAAVKGKVQEIICHAMEHCGPIAYDEMVGDRPANPFSAEVRPPISIMMPPPSRLF